MAPPLKTSRKQLREFAKSKHNFPRRDSIAITITMASYFDEHNCQPFAQGERPNHFLELARLLLDSGAAVDWNMEFADIFGEWIKFDSAFDRVPLLGEEEPRGASKEVIDKLPEATKLRENQEQCPICLAIMKLTDRVAVTDQNSVKQLPCGHQVRRCIVTLYTANSSGLERSTTSHASSHGWRR